MNIKAIWLALGGDANINVTESMLIELAELTRQKADALEEMQIQYNLFMQELVRLRDKSIKDAEIMQNLAATLRSQLVISNMKNPPQPPVAPDAPSKN